MYTKRTSICNFALSVTHDDLSLFTKTSQIQTFPRISKDHWEPLDTLKMMENEKERYKKIMFAEH